MDSCKKVFTSNKENISSIMKKQKEITPDLNDNSVLSIVPKVFYYLLDRIVIVIKNSKELIQDNINLISNANISEFDKSNRIQQIVIQGNMLTEISLINGTALFHPQKENLILNNKNLLNKMRDWSSYINSIEDIQVLSETLFDWMEDSVEYVINPSKVNKIFENVEKEQEKLLKQDDNSSSNNKKNKVMSLQENQNKLNNNSNSNNNNNVVNIEIKSSKFNLKLNSLNKVKTKIELTIEECKRILNKTEFEVLLQLSEFITNLRFLYLDSNLVSKKFLEEDWVSMLNPNSNEYKVFSDFNILVNRITYSSLGLKIDDLIVLENLKNNSYYNAGNNVINISNNAASLSFYNNNNNVKLNNYFKNSNSNSNSNKEGNVKINVNNKSILNKSSNNNSNHIHINEINAYNNLKTLLLMISDDMIAKQQEIIMLKRNNLALSTIYRRTNNTIIGNTEFLDYNIQDHEDLVNMYEDLDLYLNCGVKDKAFFTYFINKYQDIFGKNIKHSNTNDLMKGNTDRTSKSPNNNHQRISNVRSYNSRANDLISKIKDDNSNNNDENKTKIKKRDDEDKDFIDYDIKIKLNNNNAVVKNDTNKVGNDLLNDLNKKILNSDNNDAKLHSNNLFNKDTTNKDNEDNLSKVNYVEISNNDKNNNNSNQINMYTESNKDLILNNKITFNTEQLSNPSNFKNNYNYNNAPNDKNILVSKNIAKTISNQDCSNELLKKDRNAQRNNILNSAIINNSSKNMDIRNKHQYQSNKQISPNLFKFGVISSNNNINNDKLINYDSNNYISPDKVSNSNKNSSQLSMFNSVNNSNSNIMKVSNKISSKFAFPLSQQITPNNKKSINNKKIVFNFNNTNTNINSNNTNHNINNTTKAHKNIEFSRMKQAKLSNANVIEYNDKGSTNKYEKDNNFFVFPSKKEVLKKLNSMTSELNKENIHSIKNISEDNLFQVINNKDRYNKGINEYLNKGNNNDNDNATNNNNNKDQEKHYETSSSYSPTSMSQNIEQSKKNFVDELNQNSRVLSNSNTNRNINIVSIVESNVNSNKNTITNNENRINSLVSMEEKKDIIDNFNLKSINKNSSQEDTNKVSNEIIKYISLNNGISNKENYGSDIKGKNDNNDNEDDNYNAINDNSNVHLKADENYNTNSFLKNN